MTQMVAVSSSRWVREPQRLHFPVEERVPEDKDHFKLRVALYSALAAAFADRATLGSDQFVYWDPTDPTACLAPDLFVRLGAPDESFKSWKTWERGAPHVAVEIISDSDARDTPWSVKLERYRRLGVRELTRFDPEDGQQPLRAWDHVDGDLVERRLESPFVTECEPLGAYWVVRTLDAKREFRLARDIEGKDVFPTPEEAALERVRELEAELAKRG